ncbi:MAG: hypothetical protein ABIO44_00630, partial [Saprospiraceae bacterium]
MKNVFLLFIISFIAFNLNAQLLKEKHDFTNPIIDLSGKILTKPFGSVTKRPLSQDVHSLATFSSDKFNTFRKSLSGIQILDYNDQGVPKIFSSDNLLVPRDKNKEEFFSDYLKKALDLNQSKIQFSLLSTIHDELGADHSKFQELYKGIPVLNAEYIMHSYSNASLYANGYAWNINKELNIIPKIQSADIENLCKQFFQRKNINFISQKINTKLQSGIKQNYLALWQSDASKEWNLIYYVKVSPNLRE